MSNLLAIDVQLYDWNDELVKVKLFQLLQWIHAVELEIKTGAKMSQGRGRKTSTVIKGFLNVPKGAKYSAEDLLHFLKTAKQDIDNQLKTVGVIH